MGKQVLYSITDIAKITGKSRRLISGIITGAGIPTFRGANNAKQIDGPGFRKIQRKITPKPEYESP